MYLDAHLSPDFLYSREFSHPHRTNFLAGFKFHSFADTDVPLVQISMYPGRTKEQKEALANAITNAVVDILKSKREHVIITYDERPRENWYISGELL